MSRILLLAGASLGLLLGASGARADDVTAAQASSLETQVREWLGALLGPAIKITDRPVVITPAGDHYNVSVPIPVRPSVSADTIQITATARAMDGGKWSIENVKITSPMTFTLDIPVPPTGPGNAARPGPAMTTTPVRYTATITGQDGRIVWDPTFTTPSTWTHSSQGTKLHADGGPLTQDSSIGPVSTQGTLRPSGPDRVDLLSDGTLQDYNISSTTAETGKIDIGMKLIRVSMAMNGVSRGKAMSILQTLTTVIASAAATGGPPPKMAPEMVRTLLDALQDFASDFNLDETLEGMAVQAQGKAFTMDRAKVGFNAKSDRGMMQAGMDLGMEGLGLPNLPLGGLEALIPRRVAFRPVVSGVSLADLTNIAKAASEGRTVAAADINALFSHGGIKGGLDSMAIEIGNTTLSGQGKFVFTSPEAFSGDAEIVAENFDALMQKISGVPAAAQGIPVLVIAKGIGKTVGNKLIWDISYHDGKILVNNVDLAAMAGGGAPPPPAVRPNQQRPPLNHR